MNIIIKVRNWYKKLLIVTQRIFADLALADKISWTWVCFVSWAHPCYPDSKVQRADMWPIWGRQDPGGPHVAPWTLLSGYIYCHRTRINECHRSLFVYDNKFPLKTKCRLYLYFTPRAGVTFHSNENMRWFHDDVINWNIFHVTGPLWGVSTGFRWIPITKASGDEIWFCICAWTKGWLNNRNVGDFRRRCARYNVAVMICRAPKIYSWGCKFADCMTILWDQQYD